MGTDSEISALMERLAALDTERATLARRVSALELPEPRKRDPNAARRRERGVAKSTQDRPLPTAF